MTTYKLKALNIVSFLILAVFTPGAAFSQAKPKPNPQNKSAKVQNNEAPRPKLIAVLGETELEKELARKEARAAKQVPDSAKGRAKAELRNGREALDLERRVFALLNQKRAENGLSPLAWSEDMAKIARAHSIEMAEYNYFSHKGLNGSMVNDRADELGISDWRSIGENIAFNQGYENPGEFAIECWLKSASHYQNLMSRKWKQSGLGVAITKDGRYYFTQVFVLNY